MTLQGEWWLIDGRAISADGDIGDVNHEHVVCAYCLAELVDAMEASSIEWLQSLGYGLRQFSESDGVDVIAAATYLNDETDALHKEGQITAEQYDDPQKMLIELLDVSQEVVELVFDTDADGREYGVRTLGWFRVHGGNVELWRITRAVLDQLAEGLYDAYGEDARAATFHLEERATSRFYNHVPFSVIDTGDMQWFFSNRAGADYAS